MIIKPLYDLPIKKERKKERKKIKKVKRESNKKGRNQQSRMSYVFCVLSFPSPITFEPFYFGIAKHTITTNPKMLR
jgi:hypothetical protein